jgi:hypothetical protein
VIAQATLPGFGTGDITYLVSSAHHFGSVSDSSGSALGIARANMRFIELVYHGLTKEITKQLSEEPRLVEFLASAYLPLIRSFGSPPALKLTQFRDPDSEDDAAMLVVDVQAQLPMDEALERLDDFDQSWFLHHMKVVSGRVTFLLSFA